MAELTIEQRRAIAVAQARKRQAEAMQAAAGMRAQGLASPDPTAANAQAEADMQAATDEAYVRENPVMARGEAFISGVPFVGSYYDEAAGALGANTDQIRAGQEAFSRARPGQDLALKVGGGVVGSLPALPAAAAIAPSVGAMAGPSLLGRVAMGAGIGAGAGAVEGGVSGYGDGEGAERGRNAVTQAMLGGGLGAGLGLAAPAVSSGISSVAGALMSRPSRAATRSLGMSPTSAEAVIKALSADDALGGAGAQRIASAGPGAMLADAGESAAGLLDVAMQRSGSGSRVAREAVEGRASDAGQGVRAALDTLAPKSGVAVRGTPMRQLYDAAYSSPIDYSSKAGKEIEELLPRVPQAIIERANRLIQMDTDAVNPRQIMASVGPDGLVSYSEMPNVLQIDYITRALNDVARAGDGQGALGGSTNEGRIFGKLARQLRGAVKESVPAYRDALDTAATEIGARQAQELGLTAMRSSVTRADLGDELAGMGAGEVAHLRIGVRQGVEETLDNVRRSVTDGNIDARQATQALRDFSSDAAREKLRMIFGDAEARQFISQLDEAARALELRGAVSTNSRTFVRTSTDQTVKDGLNSGPVEALKRGETVGSVKSIVQALSGRTPQENLTREQEVYAEIARLLTGPRGPQAQSAAQALEQAVTRRTLSQAVASRVGQATAGAIALPAYQLGTHTLGR